MTPLLRTLDHIVSHPLNRQHRLRAVGRYFGWQLRSRTLSRRAVINYVDDTQLLIRRGCYAGTHALYTGLCDTEEMSLALHMLRPGDLFVDVGANEGTWTVFTSGAAGADSIAIEPTPITFTHLQDNIRLNHLESLVDAQQAAVGDHDGSARLNYGTSSGTNYVASDELSAQEDSIEVPIYRLDTLLGDRQANFLKIDVEGFEKAVIDGAERMLAQRDLSILIMETIGGGERYGFDDDALHRRILDFGFQTASYDPFARRLMIDQPYTHTTNNTIYVRNFDFVEDRIRTARRFHVNHVEI